MKSWPCCPPRIHEPSATGATIHATFTFASGTTATGTWERLHDGHWIYRDGKPYVRAYHQLTRDHT